MRKAHQYLLFGAMIFIGTVTSCKSKPDKKAEEAPATIKGVYTFEPGAKTFTPCGKSNQLWVADSIAQLELKYAELIPAEQLGTPVYIEVKGYKTKSAPGTAGEAFDSTLVIKKLINITKDIPADCK